MLCLHWTWTRNPPILSPVPIRLSYHHPYCFKEFLGQVHTEPNGITVAVFFVRKSRILILMQQVGHVALVVPVLNLTWTLNNVGIAPWTVLLTRWWWHINKPTSKFHRGCSWRSQRARYLPSDHSQTQKRGCTVNNTQNYSLKDRSGTILAGHYSKCCHFYLLINVLWTNRCTYWYIKGPFNTECIL